MICPGIAVDCDNPGCRHGGCQGRPPQRFETSIAAKVTLVSSRLETGPRPARRTMPGVTAASEQPDTAEAA